LLVLHSVVAAGIGGGPGAVQVVTSALGVGGQRQTNLVVSNRAARAVVAGRQLSESRDVQARSSQHGGDSGQSRSHGVDDVHNLGVHLVASAIVQSVGTQQIVLVVARAGHAGLVLTLTTPQTEEPDTCTAAGTESHCTVRLAGSWPKLGAQVLTTVICWVAVARRPQWSATVQVLVMR
jgi:hypothetical protein